MVSLIQIFNFHFILNNFQKGFGIHKLESLISYITLTKNTKHALFKSNLISQGCIRLSFHSAVYTNKKPLSLLHGIIHWNLIFVVLSRPSITFAELSRVKYLPDGLKKSWGSTHYISINLYQQEKIDQNFYLQINQKANVKITGNTYLHFQYFPTGIFSKAGFGLFGKFFLHQSIKNCFGDLPVQLRAL